MKRNPFVFVLICALLLCGCSLHDESIDRVSYRDQNKIRYDEEIGFKLSKKELSTNEEMYLNAFSQGYNAVYTFETKESDMTFELFEYKLNDGKWQRVDNDMTMNTAVIKEDTGEIIIGWDLLGQELGLCVSTSNGVEDEGIHSIQEEELDFKDGISVVYDALSNSHFNEDEKCVMIMRVGENQDLISIDEYKDPESIQVNAGEEYYALTIRCVKWSELND